MSLYYKVEPEVAGGWGENTRITQIPGKPTITHALHYQFEGWLGDALLESTPYFIVTKALEKQLKQAKLTGIAIDDVEISTSDEFNELYPDLKLPEFSWLKIETAAGENDFGVTPNNELVVSAHALEVLETAGIANAMVEPFTP